MLTLSPSKITYFPSFKLEISSLFSVVSCSKLTMRLDVEIPVNDNDSVPSLFLFREGFVVMYAFIVDIYAKDTKCW